MPQVKTSDSFSFFLNRNYDPRDLLPKRELFPPFLRGEIEETTWRGLG